MNIPVTAVDGNAPWFVTWSQLDDSLRLEYFGTEVGLVDGGIVIASPVESVFNTFVCQAFY